MTIRLLDVSPNLPLAEWSVFYVEGEPYIYDDSDLFLDEDGEHMGQHPRHSGLAIYLAELLRWLYRAELCTVTFDLFFKTEIELAATNLSAKKNRKAAARLSPDVSFIRGVRQPDKATYVVGEDGPSPDVVFEVGSESTYSEDLTNKFRLYAEAFGAKEYIAYDPHEERLWQGSRLKAWKLIGKTYTEMVRDPRGWIWSEGLQHWLVEDGAFLRLYDAQGHRRLTAQEEAGQEKLRTRQAEIQTKQTHLQFRQERKKSRQAEIQTRQAQNQAAQEKRRADRAETQVEDEKLRADQERVRADRAELLMEQERLRADRAELLMEQERLRADRAELLMEQERLRADRAELLMEQEKLRADQTELLMEQEKLRADRERLRADQVEIQVEDERLRADRAELLMNQEKQRAEQAEARFKQLEEQLRKRDAETEN